jgi:hypothetical protein
MTKLVFLYWHPGTGGDHLQRLLLQYNKRFHGTLESINEHDSGRVLPVIGNHWKEIFPPTVESWYLRDWTKEDGNKLVKILDAVSSEFLVIGSHNFSSIAPLREVLGDRMITVGITYGPNMYLLVLKNWCKKVAPINPRVLSHYKEPMHQYLIEKGAIGEQVLKDCLQFGSFVAKTVKNEFDVGVSMESMYDNNFSKLLSYFNLEPNELFTNTNTNWLKKQSLLHQFQFPRHAYFESAIGFNPLASTVSNHPLELDAYDNILLKHWCQHNLVAKQIPRLTNTQEALDYFNGLTEV